MKFDDDPDAYLDDTKVLSDTVHTACKPHACEGCECEGCECSRGGILAGDRYRQVVLVGGDEGFWIGRHCVTPGAPIQVPDRTPPPVPCGPDDLPF